MYNPRLKSRFDQSGSYVIWVLILLPVLVGSMALAFDAGMPRQIGSGRVPQRMPPPWRGPSQSRRKG
jgi:hypothetical protein